MMVFGRPLRSSEILAIWHKHHGIEQFWRHLKSIVNLASMSLMGRDGAYATIGIKVLAYLLLLLIAQESNLTLYRVKVMVQQELEASQFFNEHFHEWIR